MWSGMWTDWNMSRECFWVHFSLACTDFALSSVGKVSHTTGSLWLHFGSHKTFCIAIGWESLAFPLHVLNSFSETFLSYQNLSPLMATQETWSTKSEIIYFPIPRLPFSDFGRFWSFPSRGTIFYWGPIVYLKDKFTKMAAKVAKIRHLGFQEFRNRNMCFRKFDL